MKLFTYFRSSAAYRVRIALRLKGLAHDAVPIHLRRREQQAASYVAVNPQGLVPALQIGADVLTQSLAIIEYLDEVTPDPPLLPPDPLGRARVRALALAVACDIHPLNNLRVLRYLADRMGADEAARNAWYAHWIAEGLGALEAMAAASPATGRFCHGDQPGLADLCLVPQLYNARRQGCDVSPYPTLTRIESACLELPEFAEAAPERQPDAD